MILYTLLARGRPAGAPAAPGGIYIYIYIERERERFLFICLYIYIYIYIHINRRLLKGGYPYWLSRWRSGRSRRRGSVASLFFYFFFFFLLLLLLALLLLLLLLLFCINDMIITITIIVIIMLSQEVRGVVLLSRGQNTFSAKMRHAEAGGAAAGVVCNNQEATN